MSTPREPRGPVIVRGSGQNTATSVEPFARLATLATHEGIGAAAPPTYERRAGALIKRCSPPKGLDAAALDRIWARLGHRPITRGRTRVAAPLAWALVVIVLVVSGAVVVAKTGMRAWPPVTEMFERFSRRPSRPGLKPRVVARVAPPRELAGSHEPGDAGPPSQSPSPASSPSTVPVARPVPALGRTRNAGNRPRALGSADAPVPTQPSASMLKDSRLADESVLLGRALAHLRQQRDPNGALSDLDLYAARFPSGMLDHEAQSARVDALLMLGHLAEARTVLATLTLGTGARDRELRLIRGELNSESSCALAVEDFETLMAESRSGPLGERALWGRAACRTRLGDERGARADLADYVGRFPGGPHAAAARARLRD